MDNVNLEAGYFSSRKARRLRARLGPEGDVYPPRLWCHCAGVLKSECLRDMLPEEIEELMLWRGKAGELVALLLSKEIKFLELTACPKMKTKHYHAHDFNIRNGHILMLHERAVKAAHARWNGKG